MASLLYSRFLLNGLGGDAGGDGPIDLLSDTIKASARNAHTQDQTGDELYGDLAADESSATGYVAGGATLAGKTYTTASLTTTFDNTADITWTISSGTLNLNALVFYDDTVATPAKPLICCDTVGSQSVTGGDFVYTPNASGIFAITVA